MEQSKRHWYVLLGAAVLLAGILGTSVLVGLRPPPGRNANTVGDVLTVVLRDCLSESGWSVDGPRIAVIADAYPISRFRVTRGAPGNERVIAAGRINNFTMKVMPALFGAAWVNQRARLDGPPLGARRPLSPEELAERKINLSAILTDEELEADNSLAAGGPLSALTSIVLWAHGVGNGWFKPSEQVIIVELTPWTTDSPFDRWFYECDFAHGGRPQAAFGGLALAGYVNVNTLAITPIPTD